MTNCKLAIIIVTFNSEKYIEKCIDSVGKNRVNNIDYRIVIVDNNSKDNTIQVVKKLIINDREIVLLKNKKNTGFARAVNLGIQSIGCVDYVLLLNPDTILYKYAIINLIKCSEKNNAGICGGTTINSQGLESGSYFRFPNLMVGIFDFTNLRKLCVKDRWHKYFYYQDKKNKNKESFPVDVVTGGFMLLSKDTIERVGLIDESYFMYLEDVDYCLRAKHVGINIYHTNSSKTLHIGGASSNNKDRIRHSSWIRSRKIYYEKHFGLFENLIIQPIFLIDNLIINFKSNIS